VAVEKDAGSSPVGHPPVIRMTIIVLQQLSTLVMVERRFGGGLRRPSTTSDNQRSVDWLGGWPEEAAAILYLASEEASFVSGQVLYVAGGLRD
jgi:NAD(P)-dependent dehydrogenase (short-subunit alcohol dehydrogenase family)